MSDKQDTISDLDTIRSGASKGATAVQPESIKNVAKLDEGYVIANGIASEDDVYYHLPNTNISDAAHTLATKGDLSSAIETYIADFTMESLINAMNNGSQVNCDMQALVAAMNANKIIVVREFTDSYYYGVNVLNGYAEDMLYFSIVDSHGNVLYCDGTDYANDKSYIDGQTLFYRSWADKQDTLVSGETIKTINGENILGGGDITIEGGVGTITGVSANGTSVATSGVANIPAATTSKYGVTKLSSATNSTSTTLAATASAVKSAYDLANGRQEKLVSGTNIKTINNTSILGSGNIAIDANIQAVDTQETLDDVETNTYVKYVAQTLTDEQKAQVRENIGVVEGGKEIIANKQGTDSIFVFANDSDNGPLEPNKIYVSHFTVTFGIIIENIIPPTDLYAEYTIIFKTGGGENYEGTLMLPSYVL